MSQIWYLSPQAWQGTPNDLLHLTGAAFWFARVAVCCSGPTVLRPRDEAPILRADVGGRAVVAG